MPFKSLADLGVRFRKSQLSLIAGAPGGGKSALATNLVTRMKSPTIYFSADADRMTVAKSIVAGLVGCNQEEAERRLNDQDGGTWKTLESETEHIWWNFDTLPSLKDVEEELDGYAYVYGNYPDMLVMDNMMDMAEAGEDIGALTDVQIGLKAIARRTGCHVLVLAHVTGAYTDGNIPIPRSGMMFKPDKKAELIMTIYLVEPGIMGIGVVKNRSGPASTTGGFGTHVRWSPELGYFGG